MPDLPDWEPVRDALARHDFAEVYRWLKRHGWTHRAIAAAVAQSQSEVNEILNGRKIISVQLLERMADGLQIPRGYLGLAYAPGAQPTPADHLPD